MFILSFPSLGTLYKMEVQKRLSHFLLEVTAHQWYWHYRYTPNFWMMMRGTSYPVYHSRAGPPHLWEYAEDEALIPSPRVKNIPIEFDSFIKQDFELETGEYRLIDVNHRAIICAGQKTLFRLTREDVIHS